MRVWAPLALAITLLSGLLYVVEQQHLRTSANDPQIYLAEDAAVRLKAGVKPVTFATKDPTDIGTSLAPWLAIYDATGTPIVSTGLLHETMPQVPRGVFVDLHSDADAYPAPSGKEHRLTWQPETDVRQAIVIVEAGEYTVVAGRSLREVEERVWQMESMIGIGWVITLLVTLLAVWLGSYAQDFITFSRS